MFRKSIFLGLILLCTPLCAQTAQEEIYADLHRSASNYYAYPAPSGVTYTAPPAGYAPFYVSTYARHGSRFLINPNEYNSPLKTLLKADSAGALTPLGKEVLATVDSLARMANGRYGELTDVGAEQHRGIADRLFRNFPEAFAGAAHIEARSTPVVRCILSMMNECWVLKGLNPELTLRTDASAHDMYYMNDEYNEVTRFRKEEAAGKSYGEFAAGKNQPERLMGTLFTDTAYVNRHVKAARLADQLFDLASNMQSHHVDLDLYRLFTPEECYALWLRDNYSWYLNYGPSPLTGGKLPFTQANLVRNFIATADTVIASGHNGATLRFGHEVCVMPLASLLELDECGYATTKADEVAAHWRNYRIFPMASNVQFAFYRSASSPRILVKVMLNEREARLPIEAVQYPYYDWEAVKAYYLKKLADNK